MTVRELPEHDRAEVELVARGIATAVAPDDGLTDVQAALLEAIATALTGHVVNYHGLEPLGPDALAEVLRGRSEWDPRRIVHHMVLGELVLNPIPPEVAHRVAGYAAALGVEDDFVRVARRHAQGAHGLAWMDLWRSGFSERLHASEGSLRTTVTLDNPLGAQPPDPVLAAQWSAFRDLPPGTLGRCVCEMYEGRGFPLPGLPGGANAYLAQHDFVHVLADYGTNLKGELEVFALIGRADPDPKGFAWLATLVGLFETGYIADAGFFVRDTREHNIQAAGMSTRVADAIRRGKAVCEALGTDLFAVDYHAFSSQPVGDVRNVLCIPAKSREAVENGSASLFSREGMSEIQRQFAEARAGAKE